VVFRSRRIEAHILRLQPPNHGLRNIGAAFERRFPEPCNARVGVHLDEHQIAPSDRNFVDFEAGDFDPAGRRGPRVWNQRRRAKAPENRSSA